MECKYFPKDVLIQTLEAAQREAARKDAKFVYGLEAAIQVLRNAEPLDFAEAMSRATPKKSVLKDNTADCPYEAPYCPECGHILIDGNGDNFNFCPDCGQRIRWDGGAAP